MNQPKLLMAWSGGKDSALALHRLQQQGQYQVVGLLTTVTQGYNRISMHGVRDALLESQAQALNLPLQRVWIPPQASNALYEAAMAEALAEAQAAGVTALGFGDLFLQDIRRYRESQLAPTGIAPVFPIWGEDTRALAQRLIEDGFQATLCCVDPKALPGDFVGREYDAALLRDLPPGVDPCGENGEFHTYVHGAPNFRQPIPIMVGEIVPRDGFWYADLVPDSVPAGPARRAP